MKTKRYQNYHTYDEFVTRLSSLASTYSNIAQYVPAIGKSIQGRNIPAIIIGNSRPTGTIFWVGGQHARYKSFFFRIFDFGLENGLDLRV